VLQYTGGTTGVSKGAMLSHGNIVANVQQAGVLFSTYDFREGEESLLLPLPLYTSMPSTPASACSRAAATRCCCPTRATCRAWWPRFAIRAAPVFAGLNTLFVALCNDAGFRALDFSRLKVTMSGAWRSRWPLQAAGRK